MALATGDAAQAERLVVEATSAVRHATPSVVSLAPCVRAVLAVRRGSDSKAIAVVRENLAHIRELHDNCVLLGHAPSSSRRPSVGPGERDSEQHLHRRHAERYR